MIEERINRLRKAMRDKNSEIALLNGYGNIKYFTGIDFDWNAIIEGSAILLITESRGKLFVPIEKVNGFKNASRTAEVIGYHRYTEIAANLEYAVETKKTICIDKEHFNSEIFEKIFKTDSRNKIIEIDTDIKKIRMVKSEEEITIITRNTFLTDHGLAAALHHVLVNAFRPEKGLSELIRLHCLERGMEMHGYNNHALVASGVQAKKYIPDPPFYRIGGGKQLARGETVRIEVCTKRNGYFSEVSRMLYMGEQTEQQEQGYEKLNKLREKILESIVVQKKISECTEEIIKYSENNNIRLFSKNLGHSIGVEQEEFPMLTEGENEVFVDNMVFVLTPRIITDNDEIISNFDTVVIKNGVPNIVGWYKNWRSPYIAQDSFPHGSG
ncbi:MAG: M24 family metallopeptidase [Thermotogota bacterium]|nr:M24 family metallopeptidase [Thermotogota bacterium]